MTSVRGYRILANVCCGARFSAPRYGSMNFTAYEYWTDGQRVHSLAPTDGGLRRCLCGAYFLQQNAIEIGFEETQKTPSAIYVNDNELAGLLALPIKDDIELVVRRRYRRHLNDGYRDLNRAHRKSVDVAANEAKNPITFWTTLARKLLGKKPPAAALDIPTLRFFTVPPYSATSAQQENMHALLSLLLTSEKPDPIEIAELHRELGDYDEAQKAIEQFKEAEHRASGLIRELINEKVNEPMRFRM